VTAGGFPRVAGRLAIDLLNTRVAADGQPRELLVRPRNLAAWARAMGLPYAGALARQLARVSGGEPAAMVQFRELVRDGLARWWEGRPPRRGLCDQLNRALARDPRYPRLTRRGRAVAAQSAGIGTALDRLYADVAASVAAMLSEDDPRRYRRCANPACVLMFYDESKPGTRRWCSMQTCGGQAKARAFKRRSRREGG